MICFRPDGCVSAGKGEGGGGMLQRIKQRVADGFYGLPARAHI